MIIIIEIATRRPRLHSHQSDAPQYINTLDSTDVQDIWMKVNFFTSTVFIIYLAFSCYVPLLFILHNAVRSSAGFPPIVQLLR
jgi:hypothetical protein